MDGILCLKCLLLLVLCHTLLEQNRTGRGSVTRMNALIRLTCSISAKWLVLHVRTVNERAFSMHVFSGER